MGSGQGVEDKPSSGCAASGQLTMFKIWTCLSKKAVSIKNKFMSSLVTYIKDYRYSAKFQVPIVLG